MEKMATVFIAIQNVVGRAVEQVLKTFGVSLTKSPEEAELIIVESTRDIGSTYRTDKHYAIFRIKDEGGKLPPNARFIPALEFLPTLMEYIQEVGSEAVTEKRERIDPARLLPDAKMILVIEDTPKHQESAKTLLAGHHLALARNYNEAMECLKEDQFEIVLSDLYLPMSPETLSSEAFELGKLVPYGLLLVLEATRRGAKHVAVATDLNHHADALAAAFDHYASHRYTVNGGHVRFYHAPMTQINGEWVKDWQKILDDLTDKK